MPSVRRAAGGESYWRVLSGGLVAGLRDGVGKFELSCCCEGLPLHGGRLSARVESPLRSRLASQQNATAPTRAKQRANG